MSSKFKTGFVINNDPQLMADRVSQLIIVKILEKWVGLRGRELKKFSIHNKISLNIYIKIWLKFMWYLGIVHDSFTRVKAKFQENLNIINHRGPDNQGIYQNNQIIFGHNDFQ